MSKMRLLCVSYLSWFVLASVCCMVPPSAHAQQNGQSAQAGGPSNSAAIDMKGVWSGTLFSNHADVAPFTMTVVVTKNGNTHFVGDSSMNSDCLRGAKLQVAVTNGSVVLAGSTDEGDNITVRGTLNATGDILQASYILNGSASGKCETDDGKGQLAKR